MKEDFEFIVFNDASDPQMEKNINTIAAYNKINCARVPQNIHRIQNPSECYAQTLNWAVQEYAVKNNHEIIVLLHTDVFPICDVLISSIIGNSVVASTAEFRLIDGKPINYFYPAFTIINMKLLKNVHELDFSLAPGLDTGGQTKEFIEKNMNLVKFIPNHQTSYFVDTLEESANPIVKYFKDNLEICKKYGLSAGWIAEGFYHYIAGSQWNASEKTAFAQGHQERMNLFLRYFY